ncbi:hypothetical protein DMN91_001196 [Ooceraea biroi]|uniref:Uncharacterized protein n=1 Tax=Ooceraea biroi TaxID=2015173 RepID=A0A3L8E4C3_OOCBI|nr:hypothetical protein DMN91_001196 [Ooceraea biroi]
MGSTRIPNNSDSHEVWRPYRMLSSRYEDWRVPTRIIRSSAWTVAEALTFWNIKRIYHPILDPSLIRVRCYRFHSHNISCSPRNLDLSRNLAFEAARRVQESSNLQDNQHSLASSPNRLEKQSCSKDKLKNVQQSEPVSASPRAHAVERGVHGHFHGDMHTHIYKHADNFRSNANLDAGEGLWASSSISDSIRTITTAMSGYHHGNLVTTGLSHVHGNSGLSASGSGPINQTSSTPTGHHHPASMPIAATINHVNSPHSHHRLGTSTGLTHHTSSAFPSDHHGASGALSGASSNSSMMNHGGSPTVHRHVVNSSLSTTPLGGHHHGSSSGSLTGQSSVNHHHVSSGISCESSSSNANTRTHSRLDHVHDHHHHLQAVHSLHTSHSDTRPRDRAPSSLDHHGHHHGHVHNHGHQHGQNDLKNASLIGADAIQVSAPTKNKCQCHVVQQPGGNNRGTEGESDGGVEVASRMHQPPALPPRPPPKPTRRYETTATNQ